MRSILWVILLQVWSNTGASIASHLPRQSGPDTVYSGNYRIYNCGDQAPQITNIVETVWQFLQPSLADVNASTSSDAYNAFFHQVSNAQTVSTVISDIANGAVLRGAHFPPNKPATAPILMCANDPSKDPNSNGLLPSKSSLVRWLAKGYDHCAAADPSASRIITTSIIILCPEFFTKPLKPSSDQCMSQNSNAEWFIELGNTFAETQVAVLLHEIAHYYADAVLPTPMVTLQHQEWYQANECLVLDATEALTNPSSYVYYVISIFQNCLNFPQSVPHRDHGPELLETNTTFYPVIPFSTSSSTNATTLMQLTDIISDNSISNDETLSQS